MGAFTLRLSTATGPHPVATIEIADEADPFDVLVGYLRAIQDGREELPPQMRAFRPPLRIEFDEVKS